MEVKHKHVVDLTDRQTTVMMDAVQGDNGRILELEMLSAGEKWPLPEALAVKIRYQKPDGTGGIYDTLPDGTAAWSGEGNVLTVALAPEICTAAGRVLLQIHLMQGQTQLTTFAMGLRVQPEVEAPQVSGDYTNLSAWLETTGKKVLTEEDTAKIEQLSETTAAFAETAAQADATLEAMRQQAENGAFDGKSAYEVAVENGFEGTEEAWLASLVGPQGEKGDKGDKGEVGGIDTQFIATYGVTTSAEIEAAYQEGKQVLCYDPGRKVYFMLSYRAGVATHDFVAFTSSGSFILERCQAGKWTSTILGFVTSGGGTFSGAITLPGDPTQPLHAATKQYVDKNVLKMVTGTYVGHNEDGPSNPNSLTFDFAPKLLIIKSKSGKEQAILNLNDATEAYSESTVNVMTNIENGGSDFDYFHTEEYGFWVKVVGNTVSWYFNGATDDSLGGRNHQFSFGVTYSYIAIG